jgi:hypothetical protein
MKNLRSYKENGYNYKYIVISKDVSGRIDYSVHYTRKQAEKRNEMKLNCNGEVMTFSQAAKAYPEYFKY